MSKRDFLEEILAKKQRSAGNRYGASSKLHELKYSFLETKTQCREDGAIPSLYLVGIAACVEVAVRDALCTLIDHGSPYVERISELKQHLKFDFEIIKALQDRQISFGDLVAHLLPVSGVEQINFHLDILLGRKLRDALANVREFVEPPESVWYRTNGEVDSLEAESQSNDEKAPRNLVPDVEALMADLSRLFAARHVTAHEADFGSVSHDDLRLFFEAGTMFVYALEELITQTLYPSMPRSASGMSLVVANEAAAAYAAMEATYQRLVAFLKDDPAKDLSIVDHLRAAQEAFLNYITAEAAFEEALVSPVSGNTLRFLNAQIQLRFCKSCEERLKEVLSDVMLYKQD
jgi:hypothetical protein